MNQYTNYKPYTQNGFEWIFVPDVEQVESVSVPPSHKAWIMVQNEPIFAVRSADTMGLVTTDFYKFEKIEKPRNTYITMDQLEEALARLKGELNSEPIIQTGANKPANHAKCKTDSSND